MPHALKLPRGIRRCRPPCMKTLGHAYKDSLNRRVMGAYRASPKCRARCLSKRAQAMAVAGPLLCLAWYYTILAGFYTLYCPVLYIMFLNPNLYRKLADTLFALWELFPVALFQCCYSTQLHHYGDYMNPNENTIIVMNHRTRVDWNYVWIGLYHATQSDHILENNGKEEGKFLRTSNGYKSLWDIVAGGKSKTKFVLKDELKALPGLGWIMQMNFFLYVKRNWQEDQHNLEQFIDYYRRMNSGYRIVLFPEGTDLSNDNRRKSDRFAVAHNLPHLDFVLHPRTTGWAVLCSRLRSAGLASVYDVTVAYDAPAQTESDLLKGRLPEHVHFHVKRHPVEKLPVEEDGLRVWLADRWREKESSLRLFHSNNGTFFDSTVNKAPEKLKPRPLKIAKIGFVFWCLIDAFFTYTMIYSLLFKFWMIYHSILFMFITWKFGGFHNIQLKILGPVKN